jgi:hypothetical protein
VSAMRETRKADTGLTPTAYGNQKFFWFFFFKKRTAYA